MFEIESSLAQLNLSDVQSDLWGDFAITMTEEQKTGVANVLSGKDVVAAMPTGSGKSLIFQSITYSAVKRGLNCITLIITPLKAISYTHVTTFKEKFRVRCLDAAIDDVEAFKGNDYNALVVQPELLVSSKGKLILDAVGERCTLYVIDEAHCLKTWGGGERPFRKNFKDLSQTIAKLKNRPVILCLTATMSEISEKVTMKSLGIDPKTVTKIVKNPVNRRISYHNSKGCLNIQPLIELLCAGTCPRVIIFESSLVKCGERYLEMKEALCDAERPDLVETVEVFHSQIPDIKQNEIASSLMTENGMVRIVIATSALSMGFDAIGVQYVIHVQMTKTLEDFLQMSGRAGRKEHFKACCLLFTDDKTRDMEKCCDLYRKQMDQCRRMFQSLYFDGECEPHDNVENDGCCDICDPVVSDSLLRNLSKDKPSSTSSYKELVLCRRVADKDKKDFKKALEYQQTFYTNEMPFVDIGLTDGISLLCSLHMSTR